MRVKESIKSQILQQKDQNEVIMILCALQAGLMGRGVPVVADLAAGDAEMHMIIEETVKALGGLDIIVNRHTPLQTHLSSVHLKNCNLQCMHGSDTHSTELIVLAITGKAPGMLFMCGSHGALPKDLEVWRTNGGALLAVVLPALRPLWAKIRARLYWLQ